LERVRRDEIEAVVMSGVTSPANQHPTTYCKLQRPNQLAKPLFAAATGSSVAVTGLKKEKPTMAINRNISTATRARATGYWGSTAVAALALGATGAADLLRVPAIMQSLAHLGYPAYFANIVGVWELLGAAAILAPGLAEVKEWAYAGMVFTLSGAALSHVASGDPVPILVPLVLLGVVLASWRLRPPRRTRFATKWARPHAA
jgi:uncharacterized membrane protein YphA (DoxX/SURF4 family)